MGILALGALLVLAALGTAAADNLADSLEKISKLHENGHLTDEEFSAFKKALLAQANGAVSCTGAAQAVAKETPSRQLQTGGGGGALADVALHLKAPAAKICFGPDDQLTCLGRSNDNIVFSGGLTVGSADALQCDETRKGTLRWLAAKSALQVCNGAKWQAAGGAVLDAADEEPCTSGTPGALQWAASGVLQVCDATAEAYRRVVVVDAEGRGSFSGSVQMGYDELCSSAREGAIRWNSEDQLLEVCNGEGTSKFCC